MYALVNSKNNIVNNIIDMDIFDKDVMEKSLHFSNSDFYVEVSENETAFIHGEYVDNSFFPPKPFDTWVWSQTLKIWQPPMPEGNLEDSFVWSFEVGDWVRDNG